MRHTRIVLTPPRDTLLAASERMCSAGSPTWSQGTPQGAWSHGTPEGSTQDSAGTPPATTGVLGSPWALPSSAEEGRTTELGGKTRLDREEQGEDVAERTGPTDPRQQHQQIHLPQAAADLSAPGNQRGCAAEEQQEERRDQRAEWTATTMQHSNGGEPSPRRQAFPTHAPSRTVRDAPHHHVHIRLDAHDDLDRLRSSARATGGGMRHADGGVQGIGPCDEESRAVGALPDEANEEANAGGWYGELAIGGEREDERANDDGGIGGHETGYETRRDEEIAANDAGAEIVTIAAQGDDRHGGSPACRHAPQTNDGEAIVPGAPQPLRRSARRTPGGQAPSAAGNFRHVESDRAADPRSDGVSDQQMPAEQRARSQRDARGGADEEQNRSPRCAPDHGRHQQTLERGEDVARSAGGRRGGRGAAGRGRRASGGGPENVYQQSGRRALNELEDDNEETSSGSSFVPAESTDSTSSSESVDEPQTQTPARATRAAPTHRAGGSSVARSTRRGPPTPTRAASGNIANPPPPPPISHTPTHSRAAPQSAPGGNPIPTHAREEKSPETLAKDDVLFAGVGRWDLTKLRDSRHAPLSRHLPPDPRKLFATALLVPLLRLANDPDSHSAWVVLLFLARLTLRQLSPRRPDWKAVSARLSKFMCGDWDELYKDTVDSLTRPQPPRHQPDDIGVIARAEGLARRGSLRRAVMALEATPVCTPSPAVLEALRAKHPPAPASPPDWIFPTPDPHLSAPYEVFSKVLGRCEMGVGAGPSGTTFEHLRDASLINASVGKHLHALVNTILTGKLPLAIAELLTASRLIALTKPGGGTRPIAIGESITRLAAKTALTLTAGAARDFFLPHQFGVAVPGGAEAIIHITRTFLTVNPGALVLQADLANAFNSVNRGAIAESLRAGVSPAYQMHLAASLLCRAHHSALSLASGGMVGLGQGIV
ncbi:unnamed protein product [Closterium sp. Naga37s-1]|nr:unnamed protein product [Closterium sp. Naga37s-1]